MKNLVFCPLFLLPLFCKAQDSTFRFSAGISISADWCHRLASADANATFLKDQMNEIEAGRVGYSAGIAINYLLPQGHQLRSGIRYYDKGYEIDTLPDAGLTNMRFHYCYIELPICFGFTFIQHKKVQPLLSAGLYGGYLIGYRARYDQPGITSDNSFKSTQGLSRFNAGVSLSLGLQKMLPSNCVFVVEGVFQQSVLSISNTPLRRYLNASGISVSLTRKF